MNLRAARLGVGGRDMDCYSAYISRSLKHGWGMTSFVSHLKSVLPAVCVRDHFIQLEGSDTDDVIGDCLAAKMCSRGRVV